MARILAISSQVARGHVGLSAIVPALQALGHEVTALPTVLLSNHPGHAHVAGERVAPALLRRMLDALDRNGWLAEIDAVMTGYLPSAEHVAFACEAVHRLRAANPSLVYLCDPVIGDAPKGIYIDPAAAAAIRDQLVPLADVLKLNRFELGWIASDDVTTAEQAENVRRVHSWPCLIVTSLPVLGGQALGNAMLVKGQLPTEVLVHRFDTAPNGAGDLLGALFLGHRLKGCTPDRAFAASVMGVRIVVEQSQSHQELQLVTCMVVACMARACLDKAVLFPPEPSP